MRTARPAFRALRRRVGPATYRHAYFAKHGLQAKAALGGIEKSQGSLPKEVKQTCDEYAREALGDARHAGWLRVYSALAGEFREGWIPDTYFGLHVVPKTKGDAGRAVGSKVLSRYFLGSDYFPDVGTFVNGVLVDSQGRRLIASDAVGLWSQQADRFVIKKDGSLQGRDVEVVQVEMLHSKLEQLRADAVIQRYVTQHPWLAAFHDSVATLRLTTAVDQSGGVDLRAAYLRLGVASDSIVKSASAVKCSASVSTGMLLDQGFMPDWSATERHPTSGLAFSGFMIPNFGDAAHVVRDLHARVPFVGCVGWDVAIGDEGQVQVLEVNAEHNDIKFSEATTGPCFKDLQWEHLWKLDVG